MPWWETLKDSIYEEPDRTFCSNSVAPTALRIILKNPSVTRKT